MDRKAELLLRVYFVFFVFVLFAAIIYGQVIKIAVVEGEKWKSRGGKNIKWIEVEGERGNIYDCNGELLSTSIPQFDIYVDLKTSTDKCFNANIKMLSQELSRHFGKTANQWRSELVNKRHQGKTTRNSGAGYYSLLKNVTKEELDLLLTFPMFKLGRNKGGLIYKRRSIREKPFKGLCSRTIGLERKNASMVGLERTYDKLLRGEVENRLMRRFPGDNIWLPLFNPEEIDRHVGADIVTTLDMRFQDIVHKELEATLIEEQADAGTAILMEVKTGAIKAIVNLGKNNRGDYSEDWNYAIASATEPGSTFKLMSALVMLEDKKIDLDTEVFLNGGRMKFYGKTMYDSHMHGIKHATFKEVFAMSSNVGMASVAFKNYGKKVNYKNFFQGLERLGVSQKTGIEIFGESKPTIKNPSLAKSAWSGLTVPWMAHGYELKMTPLQILNVYNAVANDGVMLKPHLTKEIKREGKTITKVNPQILNNRFASPETIVKAQELLTSVAERGTARKLKIDNISFAGKTGTTVVNYWKGLDKKEYNASFAGYFPADDPEYSMIVVVYKPKGQYYGAAVAGKVFARVVERISGMGSSVRDEVVEDKDIAVEKQAGYNADFKGILDFIGLDYSESSSSKWVEMDESNDEVVIAKKKIAKRKVPDLKGMGLRDATYVIESLGMAAEVEGVGQVYKQSISPGAIISDQRIKIYLN